MYLNLYKKIKISYLHKNRINLPLSPFFFYSNTTMQESQVLKNCLNKAQYDIEALLTEKQTLLNTVRSLQHQLLARTAGMAGCSAPSSPDGATAPNNR